MRVSSLLEQSVSDEFRNRSDDRASDQLADRRFAATSSQVHAAIQAQSEKEGLFQSSRARNRRSSAGASPQRIFPGHPRWRTAPPRLPEWTKQHGMRIDAEAQIRLPRPVFEIVARLGSGSREVGNFVLRDAGRFELFAAPRDRNRQWPLRPGRNGRDSAFRRRSLRGPDRESSSTSSM